MKKFLAILLVSTLMVSTKAFADKIPATPKVSPTPSGTATPGTQNKTSKKKKKALAQTTPTAVVATPTPAASSTKRTTMSSSVFSTNLDLYDRIGAPGDLRQAAVLAANNYGSSPRHDRSLFLWLGKITSGDAGKSSYIRLSIDSIELGGPKKPWIVLAGTVEDQSGSDCKAGSTIEVAIDFRDVKVDYEGTKLGEVQKGNDIADQIYDMLMTHSSYQWVVLADNELKNSQSMSDRPAFVVKAKDGYSFLETLESRR